MSENMDIMTYTIYSFIHRFHFHCYPVILNYSWNSVFSLNISTTFIRFITRFLRSDKRTVLFINLKTSWMSKNKQFCCRDSFQCTIHCVKKQVLSSLYPCLYVSDPKNTKCFTNTYYKRKKMGIKWLGERKSDI